MIEVLFFVIFLVIFLKVNISVLIVLKKINWLILVNYVIIIFNILLCSFFISGEICCYSLFGEFLDVCEVLYVGGI